MTTHSEHDRLNAIAIQSQYAQDVYIATLEHCFDILKRFLQVGRTLELGPAEGMMTDRLYRLSHELTVVEGASRFCNEISARCPEAEIVNCLFEDYQPTRRFQNIVLGHVLEHVVDPVDLLRRAGTWLAPGGTIFAAVPNSHSLHRQAAVIMGLLPSEDALNELDVQHGHRRVYSPESLRRDFDDAKLTIDVFGGYFVKANSQAQLARISNAEMIKAFCVLGELYPDISAEIYVVARQ
jgi:2-polyprenyl-3-methyl-5-hydroxy-6-metoxy-1,4-benzoquinol methylase